MRNALLAVLAVVVAVSVRAELPPAFTDLTLDAAKKQVDGTEKLVLVKFTAEWCGPCKAMDKTTWQDEKVVAWVKEHGVAIQVDVDKDQKIAGNFQIAAMPTMVMLKGGNEIARKVGYMDASRTLTWMNDASAGKLAEGPKVDKSSSNMQERLATARELGQAGKADAATEEFVWLWENMVEQDPSMTGVRSSFMANDMTSLAARHAPAKIAFTKLRDGAEEKLKSDERNFRILDDWIVLNGIVGDQDRTLAWFDRIKKDDGSRKTLELESFRIERLLVDNGRLADIPLIRPNPLRALRTQYQRSSEIAKLERPIPEGLDAVTKEMIQDSPWEHFREQTAILYTGYLAAGQDNVAAEIMAEARKLYDKPRLITGVIRFAIKSGQARPAMRELLDEAANAGTDVKEMRAQLEAALQEKK